MKGSFLLLALVFTWYPGLSLAVTGREVVEKSRDRIKPHTLHTKVKMTISKGKAAAAKVKNFEVLAIEEDGAKKALISFLRPAKMKLLTHSFKDGTSTQWVRTASGRKKKVSSSLKSRKFAKSHFTYEDLMEPKISDYSYELLMNSIVGDDNCYVVMATPVGKSKYDRKRLYFRVSDYWPLRAEFIKNGQVVKTLTSSNIRQIHGYLTPQLIVMEELGKGKTVMEVAVVAYDKPIKRPIFNRNAL